MPVRDDEELYALADMLYRYRKAGVKHKHPSITPLAREGVLTDLYKREAGYVLEFLDSRASIEELTAELAELPVTGCLCPGIDWESFRSQSDSIRVTKGFLDSPCTYCPHAIGVHLHTGKCPVGRLGYSEGRTDG